MEIDTRLLRYFVAVAEELSFSRAAQRLHISQPPLSYAIRQLEDSLGAQLLVRTSRQVALTPAGRALYTEAVFLLRRNADLHSLVTRIHEGLQGQLKIGFVGTMLYRRLPTVLAQCRQQYPGVEHVLFELNSAEQIDLLARGGLDIGFIHANPVPEAVGCVELMREPFSICLPARHRLASRTRLDLSELAKEDFVFFSRAFSPVYYETLLALCVHAGFLPKVKYESRHWLSVASLVSQEMGVSIVPSCLSHSGLANIRLLPFHHRQRSVTSLIWSKSPSSRIRENHVALIRQAYGLSSGNSQA
ncbi:LysR family transcriptional regulator [Allopusillimonas soli]|uniref:LysR family transcriptional regulator n=1 Tax=Allopusillimonas soli TaxID=659016 RepID=A0A853FC67_9BURK|nr:LysR family transcriptional regulator [Allopusillimonas soli]NYT37242.1 LysR family transcriptional regulator [Allopusillimonas soli]TEA74757.1 LysR family transcriptional regulator [Allopusillimonas soli]